MLSLKKRKDMEVFKMAKGKKRTKKAMRRAMNKARRAKKKKR